MSSDPKPAGDTEVRPVAKHRTFTAEAKLRILTAYENASNSLERAAVLRHEGIYSSHISIWRKARDGGGGKAADEKKPIGRPRDPQAAELARLRNETARLQKELSKAQQIIDVQGKVSALLQMFVSESAEKRDA
jgi:transposase-like protein